MGWMRRSRGVGFARRYASGFALAEF